jgi:hypothetical protein
MVLPRSKQQFSPAGGVLMNRQRTWHLTRSGISQEVLPGVERNGWS